MKSKRVWPSLAVFVCCLAYFLLFRRYGFQLEDEGTLLFQLDRAIGGQDPYVDFHTGYTPGFFYGGAALLDAVGRSTAGLRLALALINATAATLLYRAATRVCRPGLAALATFSWVAFLPVYRGSFAAFNIPYPTWPATLAWALLAVVLLAWSRRGGLWRLAAAGAVAAAAFALKPNAGAFALAASVWAVAALSRRDSRADDYAVWAACAAMFAGVWFATDFTLFSLEALVYVMPAAAVALLCAGPLRSALLRAGPAGEAASGAPSGSGSSVDGDGERGPLAAAALPGAPATLRGATAGVRMPRGAIAVATLGGAFLAASALWAIPFLARLGVEGFLREVLLVGSGYGALYYKSHPGPQPYALLLVAAAAGVALFGRLARKRMVSPATPVLLALGGIAVVAFFIARYAPMPEGFASSLVWQLENGAFWLVPAVNIAGIALLYVAARRAVGGGAGVDRGLVVLVPLAVGMYLQVYPRADFMHLVCSAPLSAVVAAALLGRVARWWIAADWPAAVDSEAVVGTLIALGAGFVLAVRLGLSVGGPLAAWSQTRDLVDSPRMSVFLEPRAADAVADFGAAATYLRNRCDLGEPVLAFPAVTGALFAAGLSNPLRHDYWYPGRPDHDDEAAMLEQLKAAPPRFALALNDSSDFFMEAPIYFAATGDFVRSRYRLAARFGRFDILALPGVAGSEAPVLRLHRGPIEGAIQSDLAARRQGVARWMAALTVEEASRAQLPEDSRDALLLLRAINDGGDIRAAGWLLAGERRAEPRVRSEALHAMSRVAEKYRSMSYGWAGDVNAAAYAPFLASYVEGARVLLDDPQAGAFAAQLLAIVDQGAGAARRDADADRGDGADARGGAATAPRGGSSGSAVAGGAARRDADADRGDGADARGGAATAPRGGSSGSAVAGEPRAVEQRPQAGRRFVRPRSWRPQQRSGR